MHLVGYLHEEHTCLYIVFLSSSFPTYGLNLTQDSGTLVTFYQVQKFRDKIKNLDT
jgi:hypothetical protein